MQFPLSGYPNSRFGFDINNPKFYDIARELSLNNNIVLEGIHSHFPYRDVNTFYERVERMFEVYDNVSEFCDLKFIDMGVAWVAGRAMSWSSYWASKGGLSRLC